MTKYFKILMFCLLAAGLAHADQPDDGTGAASTVFKFGGFGTLGVSHSSQGLGDYLLDSTIPQGPGRSSNWSFGNDSRIGVQVSADFTPQVSAVLQAISEYQSDNTYSPAIEWANVKYAFTPDAYVQVGRIALPTFLNSDSRKVGYSYPWIHPPLDLYRQLAITNSDGVDMMYRFEVLDSVNSVKLLYGSNRIERPSSVSDSRDMWGFFDTLEYEFATLRVGYQKRVSSSLNLLTGVTGAWIQNTDLSVGVGYDLGNWFAMSEWMQRRSTIKVDAMYVSGGYRFADFTPYLVYSQNSPGAFMPGFPPPTAASIQLANRAQSTVSAGLRWDFMKNTDLKLQYDQVRLSNDSNGYLANLPANTVLYGSRFHVVSAVVDFIF